MRSNVYRETVRAEPNVRRDIVDRHILGIAALALFNRNATPGEQAILRNWCMSAR
jgi:hypothetical protein